MGCRGVWDGELRLSLAEQRKVSYLIFYRKFFTYRKGVGIGEGGVSPQTDQPKAFSLKAVPVGRCMYKVFMCCGSLQLQTQSSVSFE